jgi:NADPH:quinone reductase-like Zn-dependent oxidoreductase
VKAIVQDRYGPPDLLELRQIDEPAVNDDEVLVRVRAASVHPDVWHMVCGVPYVLRLMGAGVRRPKIRIPGTDVAGHVAAVGTKVTRYDFIFDIPGNHSFATCRRALTPRGTYVLIGHDHYGRVGHRILGSLPRVLKLVAMSPFVSQLPKLSLSTPPKKNAMAILKEFLEAGKLTPVIDRTFPLSEAAEAIRYLAEGRARGKVVITV